MGDKGPDKNGVCQARGGEGSGGTRGVAEERHPGVAIPPGGGTVADYVLGGWMPVFLLMSRPGFFSFLFLAFPALESRERLAINQ